MSRRATQLEWTDEHLAAFWGYYAEQRQEDYFTRLFGARILGLTRRFYRRESIVCDYGCGFGYLLERLLQTHRAAGCDLAEANIAEVRKRLGGHRNLAAVFRVGEPPVDLKCDAVYVVETVEHILMRHEEQFFVNLVRLLRPGGVVIATTPNAETLAAETVYCPCCRHEFHRWQHVRSFDASSLAVFFGDRGFEHVETFTTDFAARTPWQGLKARLRPVLGRTNPHLVYVGRKRTG
jgi:2-polyprenyl-3-methyl-5-hydroxy-6-metoxy-1,4-benzoquinol methylase